VVADPGWRTGGASAEIAATIAQEAFDTLRSPVERVALPDAPAPTSRAEEAAYYPGAREIVWAARRTLETRTRLWLGHGLREDMTREEKAMEGVSA
jgi:pyruvate/2-oxoglutarate/acetoin dehydrogenase E1 component